MKFEHIHLLRKLFIPLIAILIPFILILLQPDLGTSLTVLLLGSLIFFLVGVKIWKFIVIFLSSFKLSKLNRILLHLSDLKINFNK